MTIVAYVPNLLDRSRFGRSVTFVDDAAEATAARPDIVLVDLDRCDPGELGRWRLDGARVVGFGSHVDEERQRSALDAGWDEVLARSVFFRRLPDLLTTATGTDGR
ncbi:MAG: hypothetical protein ACFCVK_01605 [Acidimicrobiales bacterium]